MVEHKTAYQRHTLRATHGKRGVVVQPTSDDVELMRKADALRTLIDRNGTELTGRAIDLDDAVLIAMNAQQSRLVRIDEVQIRDHSGEIDDTANLELIVFASLAVKATLRFERILQRLRDGIGCIEIRRVQRSDRARGMTSYKDVLRIDAVTVCAFSVVDEVAN